MNKEFPKISIITPSYNQGDFIEETIKSVLNQNYPNLEYIIIDGGSQDETINILKKYEDHLTYWISEKDAGQADAINKGLKIASGDIIAWLNSDDLYLPNALKIVADTFTEAPEIDFIFGNCIFFNEHEMSSYVNIIETSDFQARQLGQFPYSQPSTFFKRKLIENYGVLNTSLHYCLDVDLYIRFALNCEMKYVNQTLSKFRLHNKSKTVSSEKMFVKEWVSIYLKTLRSLERYDYVDFLKSLMLDDNKNDKYLISKKFKNEQVEKSILFFLNKQLPTILGKKINHRNCVTFLKIKKFISTYGSEAKKIISFPFDDYFWVINKHFLNPAILLEKLKYKILFSDFFHKAVLFYNKNINRKAKRHRLNTKSIPIIINNFNQLDNLIKLISFLKDKSYTNIIVLDNSSTYPPLLEFYEQTDIEVIKLKENVGHMAFWKVKHVFDRFSNGYYVVTDPDVLPVQNCPDDFLEKFILLLKKYPNVNKVGFGLILDDIPNEYPLKESVLAWERKFWVNALKEDNAYNSKIDTTFALYRPYQFSKIDFYAAIRTAAPYLARHMGWYINPNNLTEEQTFYFSTVNNSSSWVKFYQNKSNHLY